MVIEALEPVTTFPPASSTLTTTEASAEPAVPLAGWVVKTSFDPVPAAMLNELLVALVRPVEAAVSVYDQCCKTKLLNVATPFTAATVVVPPTPDGVDVIVTDAEDVLTRLPLASCTCTATLARGLPAVPFVGCVEYTSFAATPAAMLNELLVALVRPVEPAESVYEPAAVKTRLLNVATPFTAATVVVPPTPDGVEVMVTDAVDVLTRLPPASCTCTATLARGLPAVPFVGCVEYTSFAATPAAMLNELLVALVRPVEAAVNV